MSSDPAPRPARRLWRGRIAVLSRWLHIYTSVLGLAAVLFFSLTGLTLNHPDWSFGFSPRESTHKGTVDAALLSGTPDQLRIAEYLRKTHGLRGTVEEFRTDEQECSISFKGPGYSADVFVNRGNGTYEVSELSEGPVAWLNDLHKGRHTGGAWSVVIDVSAVLLIIISLSGLILLLYIKRRRRTGLFTALAGGALLVAVAWWWIA